MNKLAQSLVLTLLSHGVFGELKNFKTEIVIPGETEKDEPRTITITADALHIHMNKNKEGK